ncbi:hypothetical protein [Knoellia sp. p5-6-4]|uniref:hypothetical protein n=1 Tax=unclassified Knoellia TaxID=2618719 RepID=UPI0023D9A830|nr:hypothetical protein [Knoellia sp. p5-6-4]MDF2144144.1 hypothetical protein [Knoellia sp. p5-6-4]
MRARRVPVQDEVVRNGESVVLLGRQVIRLSAIGTTLLELTGEWREVDDLTVDLTDRFGHPPEGYSATDMTEAALQALHAQGLVELG